MSMDLEEDDEGRCSRRYTYRLESLKTSNLVNDPGKISVLRLLQDVK